MNPAPTISVLMSVRNGESYVREAIESILGQTYVDFEFIIIDDVSTDCTTEILASYSDPRIRIIRNEQNLGLTASLNKALREARGTYIARMDADDISVPERFEKQVTYLDSHSEIACIGTATTIINDKGLVTGSKKAIESPAALAFHLLIKNQITHSSVMFRRNVIMELGGYDESFRFAQDYELWSRLTEKGYRFSNLPEALLQYRYHAHSRTQGTERTEAYASALSITKKNISRYISISDTDFSLLTQALHTRRIVSLSHLYRVRALLKTIMQHYLKNESIDANAQKTIVAYITHERRSAINSYMRSRLSFLRKIFRCLP